MHSTQVAQSPVARALAPAGAGLVCRAQIGGRVESTVDARTLDQLLAAGRATELDYLGADAGTARDLELALLATATWTPEN
jgi:hypothetical protein